MKGDSEKLKVHFVGIGGIGMSALAQHMAHEGHAVRGSDLAESSVTQMLAEKGITVFLGHDAAHVGDADLCVRTGAVHDDNAEIVYCRQNNIKILSREELLGIIFNAHQKKIAVAGSHGKTTTCGMLAAALSKSGENPTAFIGGLTKRGNYIAGGETCIVEACEYKASFLTLKPDIGVLLNVDTDHMDYYKDLLGVERAFNSFAKKVGKEGYVVYNGDQIPYFILKGVRANRISYGFDKENDFRACNLKHTKGLYSFEVYKYGEFYASAELRIRGKHNIYNALATIVVCDLSQTDTKLCLQAINEFEGVERRWTQIECGFTNVVEDYAHHPNEIKALIETALQQGYEKVIVAFQPHTYSRTHALFNEFVTCFDGAGQLFLLPVYAAREDPIEGVTSVRLAEVIDDLGKIRASAVESFEKCAEFIRREATVEDLVLVVGAGNINKLSDILKDQ